MTPKQLQENLKRQIILSDAEVEAFYDLLSLKKIQNRKYVLKSGEVCSGFRLVTNGCLMNYYSDREGDAHVLQFATRMWWTADLNSLIHQVPAENNIRAIGDSEMMFLSYQNMQRLYEEVPKFERYFRIIFQNALITHQKRIIQNISETAEVRYLKFRKKYPEIEQLVPLKYIASYLGITPEFLSKIRRNIAKGSIS